MNFKKNVIIGISCILSMIGLGYFMYNILKNYQPKELLSLYPGYIICIGSVILSIRICCISYRIDIQQENPGWGNSTLIQKIVEQVEYIDNCLRCVFVLWYEHIPPTAQIARKLANGIIKIDKVYSYIFIVMDVGIRLILALVFFIEVSLFESFELFSKVFLIIVIPRLLDIIVYACGYIGLSLVLDTNPLYESEDPQVYASYCLGCYNELMMDWSAGKILQQIHDNNCVYSESLLANRFYVFIHIIYILSWGIIIIKAI